MSQDFDPPVLQEDIVDPVPHTVTGSIDVPRAKIAGYRQQPIDTLPGPDTLTTSLDVPRLRATRDRMRIDPNKSTSIITGPRGPIGPDGADGAAGYLHTQLVPASVWSVIHGLGFKPVVEVFNAGSVEVDAETHHLSANNLEIHLIAPETGFARMV